MKKLTALLVSTLISLAIGCGDNRQVEEGAELSPGAEEFLIIPELGQSMTALASAEDAGFTEPLYFADIGVIAAFGDRELVSKALDLPGIEDIVQAGIGHPLDPNNGYDIREPSPSGDRTFAAPDLAAERTPVPSDSPYRPEADVDEDMGAWSRPITRRLSDDIILY